MPTALHFSSHQLRANLVDLYDFIRWYVTCPRSQAGRSCRGMTGSLRLPTRISSFVVVTLFLGACVGQEVSSIFVSSPWQGHLSSSSIQLLSCKWCACSAVGLTVLVRGYRGRKPLPDRRPHERGLLHSSWPEKLCAGSERVVTAFRTACF